MRAQVSCRAQVTVFNHTITDASPGLFTVRPGSVSRGMSRHKTAKFLQLQLFSSDKLLDLLVRFFGQGVRQVSSGKR